MTRQITGALYKTMIMSGAAAIDNNKVEINELNVFPVPDGDTGTNMSLTMGAGATALADSAPGTIGRSAEITANALLRGARGNSGVILSLLFRGVARHLKDMDTADAVEFAAAITAGVESAYKAVMKPTEGTILTVSRLAAAAAVTEAERSSDIEVVLERALKAGYEALANTINLNPVLKKAGVIDAGGKGYLYILEGMLKALRGDSIVRSANAAPPEEYREKADFAEFDTKDIRFAYCTEFIISRKTKKEVDLLRDFLDIRGDSIVVVDDDEIIKVHVHSNEPGVILTEALTYGPLVTVKVENMREQHTVKLVEGGSSRDTGAEITSDPEPQPEAPETPAVPDPAEPEFKPDYSPEYRPVSEPPLSYTTMDTEESEPEEETALEEASMPEEVTVRTPRVPVEADSGVTATGTLKFSFNEEPERGETESEESFDAESPEVEEDTTQESAAEDVPYAEEVCVIDDSQKQYGIVAVCAGEGMANVFRDLGADNIIIGGQTMNPSTEDILTQIEATPADTVFVLPNNKNIIMAAQQCMRLTNKKVVVIPSKTMPQGISALISFDAGATVGENVRLMSIAISRVHTAQITYAARDSSFDGQIIKAGDYIALIEDALIATGKDSAALMDSIAYSLSQYAPEFITIFYGEDVDEATANEVLKRLSAAIPEAETSVVYGGQPVYYFLISAE